MALECFKVFNKLQPTYKMSFISSIRYTNTAILPKAKTTKYGLKTFRYESVKLWNSLPKYFRNLTTLNQFKANKNLLITFAPLNQYLVWGLLQMLFLPLVLLYCIKWCFCTLVFPAAIMKGVN
jgi:hypothetical protein